MHYRGVILPAFCLALAASAITTGGASAAVSSVANARGPDRAPALTSTDVSGEGSVAVISQSPSAGTHVVPGSSVDFTYSTSPKNGCGTPN